MNKIEKTTERTIKETKTVYVAVDGTEFYSEEECKTYEESAIGTLMIRLKMEKIDNHIYKTLDNFFDDGCNRCDYYSFSVDKKNLEDVIHLVKVYEESKHWNCLAGKWYEEHKNYTTREVPVYSELKPGFYIFCINTDCGYISLYNKDIFLAHFNDAWDKTFNPITE